MRIPSIKINKPSLSTYCVLNKQGMLMTVFNQLWKKGRDHLFSTSVCLAIHRYLYFSFILPISLGSWYCPSFIKIRNKLRKAKWCAQGYNHTMWLSCLKTCFDFKTRALPATPHCLPHPRNHDTMSESNIRTGYTQPSLILPPTCCC